MSWVFILLFIYFLFFFLYSGNVIFTITNSLNLLKWSIERLNFSVLNSKPIFVLTQCLKDEDEEHFSRFFPFFYFFEAWLQKVFRVHVVGLNWCQENGYFLVCLALQFPKTFFSRSNNKNRKRRWNVKGRKRILLMLENFLEKINIS